MPRNAPSEPRKYQCLFCGETFHASEVLFADEITKSSQTYPDPVLVRHYAKFISAPDQIPTQLLHRWDRLLQQNLDFSSGEEMPFSIYARCYDGQLNLDEPAAAPTQADAGAALLASLAENGTPGNTAGQLQDVQKELLRGVPEGMFKTIDKRICPYCHCTVPRGLGQLPAYRVSMLGGTSSGKTTYMLLAAQQMTTLYPGGNVLNNVLGLANGALIGESEAYFRKIHDLYMAGRLQGTPIAEYIPKPVFPLVFLITPIEGKEPFFLTLQDYPGEGMVKGNHLINSPNTLAANGVILLVDPEQLMINAGVVAKSPDGTDAPPRRTDGEDSPPAQATAFDAALMGKNAEANPAGQAVGRKVETEPENELHCVDDLPQTARILSINISRFTQLQKIIVTLSKLDCLYKENASHVSVLQRGLYPTLDNGNLRTDHQNVINRSVLNDLHLIMTHVFSTFERSIGNPEKDYANLKQMLGCAGKVKPEVTLKAVSCRAWDDARMEFVQFVDNQAVLGHRLLEPLLELLADARLLPSTDSDEAETHTRLGKRTFAQRFRNR